MAAPLFRLAAKRARASHRSKIFSPPAPLKKISVRRERQSRVDVSNKTQVRHTVDIFWKISNKRSFCYSLFVFTYLAVCVYTLVEKRVCVSVLRQPTVCLFVKEKISRFVQKNCFDFDRYFRRNNIIKKKDLFVCECWVCCVCVPFGVSRHLEDSCFFPATFLSGRCRQWRLGRCCGQQFETTTQKGGKERKKNWLFHSSRGSLLKHFFFFDKVIERKGK